MAKILLVEDDQSLREIYGIRLTAEGYEIVTAGDGEEALAMAVKEKPDLIISDVMMPKISGFDMLDILRSTPETKDIKVIMMTALSSEDQRERGESLGADRFLVKSQVGIEDVVNAVHEVLGDNNPATPTAVTQADFIQPGTATAMNQSVQAIDQNMQAMDQNTQPIVQNSQSIDQNTQPIGQMMNQNMQSMNQNLQQINQTIQPANSSMQPINQTDQNTQVVPTEQLNQSTQATPAEQPLSQNTQTVNQSNAQNLTNDSYSINTVTDESGMNIKDQMDQILGGMGTV